MERHCNNFLRPKQQTLGVFCFLFFSSLQSNKLFFHPSQLLSLATKSIKTCISTYLSVLGSKLSESPGKGLAEGGVEKGPQIRAMCYSSGAQLPGEGGRLSHDGSRHQRGAGGVLIRGF